jgi:hypothetical protein
VNAEILKERKRLQIKLKVHKRNNLFNEMPVDFRGAVKAFLKVNISFIYTKNQ